MLCSNCGKEVTEGKKFCGYCGQPLATAAPFDFDDEARTRLEETPRPPDEAPRPMPERPSPGVERGETASKPAGLEAGEPVSSSACLCPVCGATNPSYARFCNVCSANLVTRQAPPGTTATPLPPVARPGTVNLWLGILAWIVGGVVALGSGALTSFVSGLLFSGLFDNSDLSGGVALMIGGLGGGAFGGFLTGLAFLKLKPGFGWQNVFIVSGVWTACGLFFGLVGLTSDGILASLVCGLPVSVMVGSGVLFWQVRQVVKFGLPANSVPLHAVPTARVRSPYVYGLLVFLGWAIGGLITLGIGFLIFALWADLIAPWF